MSDRTAKLILDNLYVGLVKAILIRNSQIKIVRTERRVEFIFFNGGTRFDQRNCFGIRGVVE